MSRIYDNKPLQALPLLNVQWPTPWNPKVYQSGNGVLVEGIVADRHRYMVHDSTGIKKRYLLLTFRVDRAHKRQYDASGKEVEPNFSQTAKVRTGYLHSSYKIDAKGTTDNLPVDQVCQLINKDDLLKQTTGKYPAGCVILWLDEKQTDQMEYSNGDSLRLKTSGDGPFVASIAKIDTQSSTVANYAGGEDVGASWTDKVLAVKTNTDRALPQDQVEGVDDDEWDD